MIFHRFKYRVARRQEWYHPQSLQSTRALRKTTFISLITLHDSILEATSSPLQKAVLENLLLAQSGCQSFIIHFTVQMLFRWFFFLNKNLRYNRNLKVFLRWYFLGLFFINVVISNSKQVDFMNAVTKWLMYDVIYNSQTATIQTWTFKQSVNHHLCHECLNIIYI